MAGTLFGVSAAAEPIALTGGVLNLRVGSGFATGSLSLTGDRGFTFDSSMNGTFSDPEAPLIPGTTMTFKANAIGLDISGGTATLDGVTYHGVGGLNSPAFASLQLVTTVTLPPITGSTTVAAPFSLDLLFTTPNVTYSLFGTGTANISLIRDAGSSVPGWRVTAVSANVSNTPAPTPEPTALLLVIPSLGWIAMRTRRTHRPLALLSGNS